MYMLLCFDLIVCSIDWFSYNTIPLQFVIAHSRILLVALYILLVLLALLTIIVVNFSAVAAYSILIIVLILFTIAFPIGFLIYGIRMIVIISKAGGDIKRLKVR